MDKAIEAIQLIYKQYIEENPDSKLGCVKKVIWGDPIKIAYDDLPAICIEPTGTPFNFYSGYTERRFGITIYYIDSLKDYLTSEDCDVVEVKKNVVCSTEGTDPCGKILEDTIVGLLYKMGCIDPVDDEGNTLCLIHDINDISTSYELQPVIRGVAVYQSLTTFTAKSAAPTF